MVFVFDGDLWTVASEGGVARRLTVSLGDEWAPLFSPDGKQIVFRSERNGDYDLYVMPAEGGPARRLTWHGATDDPCCWLPDGSGVIFSSARSNQAYDLWVQKLDGSEPWPITDGGFRESEMVATINAEGNQIVYTRRATLRDTRRRGYAGTAQGDLWICDFDGIQTSNHRPLVESFSNEYWPEFIGDNVNYVTLTSPDGKPSRVARLASVKAATGKAIPQPAELVDPREYSVTGRNAVFTTGAYGGWKLGTLIDGEVNFPEIQIKSDLRTGIHESFSYRSVTEFAASPDGKLIAFIAGHDLYVMPADKSGKPKRVMNTIGRERCIDWHPKERKLVVSSEDENFVQQVVLHNLVSGETKTLTSAEQSATNAQFSPDGKRVLYIHDSKSIRDVDLEGKAGFGQHRKQLRR